jgi:two-component system, NtrC family, sensor histidine kinase HydH
MDSAENSQYATSATMGSAQRGVVLICDDEPWARDVTDVMLREMNGYETLLANDGSMAIEIATARRIDVAIVDINMEQMDGFFVLRKLKEIDPAIEVIIMTGMADNAGMNLAFELGAGDYLSKPFRIEELLEAVNAAMSRRRDPGPKPRQLLQPFSTIAQELGGQVLVDTTSAFIHKLVSQIGLMGQRVKEMEDALRGVEGDLGTHLRESSKKLQDSLGTTRYLLQRFRNAVGRHPGLMRPTNVSNVLSDVRAHILAIFPKPLELVLPGERCEILGDYELLWHLFENLIRNGMEALESCEDGRVTVTAVAIDHCRELVVTVADNGPGIPPEVVSRIFDPSYSTKPKGLGIGLHLVRRAANIHGGQVDCKRNPGIGTTFIVHLPFGREIKPPTS